jgi:hypothetical protein
MINWEERIAQLYDWTNTLDDEETVTIIRGEKENCITSCIR